MWKEASADYNAAACRLYSACLRLCVQPESWKLETIIPIPKKAGAAALTQLRPLKLLEVAKKAVQAILKRRMATELEAKEVLNDIQCGFRPGMSCHTAALRMQALFEDAQRHHRELHVVLLDIEKAYDSVDRSWGKRSGPRAASGRTGSDRVADGERPRHEGDGAHGPGAVPARA